MISNFGRREWVAMVAGALCGCRKPAAKRETRLIRVSAARQPTMAGLYGGIEWGHFRDQGIEVDLQELRGGSPQSIPALSTGVLDVGFSSIAPASINAIAQGANVRIAAGRDVVSADCGDFGTLYATPRFFPTGLGDLRVLKGKRVAVSLPMGITAFALDRMLEAVGLTIKDIQPVYLAQPEAIAALKGGHIHAMMAQTLYGASLEEMMPELLRHPGFSQILPGFQYAYIYYGSNMLQHKDDAGARFMAAYLKGCREFVGGRTPRFVDDLAKANGADPEKAKSRCRTTVTVDGTVNLKSLQYYIDWSVKRGYSPQSIKAESMVETRFLTEARRLAA